MKRIRVRAALGDPTEWHDERGSEARACLAGDLHTTLSRMPAVRTPIVTVPDDAAPIVFDRHDTPLLPSRPEPVTGSRATLTVMAGPDAGLVIPLEAGALVIGRDPSADLWVDDVGVSRRHARVHAGPDGGYYVEDLGSRNGTFVGPRRVSVAALTPGDHVQLGSTFVLCFAVASAADVLLSHQLYESSTRDALTDVFNRRYFAERFSVAFSTARRLQTDLALLMIDVDLFKEINDRYGHLAGDSFLRAVAAQIAESARGDDFVARYGGEEFVLLSATRVSDRVLLAEEVRAGVERLTVGIAGVTVSVTVSVGIATLQEIDPLDGPPALTALADARLYAAKRDGRNRVCGA